MKTWSKEITKIEWQNLPVQLGDNEVVSGEGDWAVFSETVPNIEVRIGAIYALERIAQDSARDHIQVMEILTSYIRENAPVTKLAPKENIDDVRPRTDIQVALDVIGRRTSEQIALEHSEKFRLDLSNVDLLGANFSHGNFEGAILSYSNLEATMFRGANLRAARFHHSLLSFSNFYDADLTGAVLDYSKYNRGEHLPGIVVAAKSCRGLSLAGADISAGSHLTSRENKYPTFGTKDTKLDYQIQMRREELTEDIEQFNFLIDGIAIDDEAGVRARLQKAGFLYWSPFDASDLSTSRSRKKLWDDIGLIGFPFEN